VLTCGVCRALLTSPSFRRLLLQVCFGKMFRVRVLAAFTWGADDCDGVVANCYCCCTDPVDCLALSPCNNFLLCGFANGDLSFQTNEVQIAAQLKQALNDLGIGEGGIGAL